MTVSKLDPTQVEALWDEHATGVRRFLIGVLKNADAADEALQQTFVTVVERGHAADSATIKGWIYRVAFRHALQGKRRDATGTRAVQAIRDALATAPAEPSAAQRAMQSEDIERTRACVRDLPEAQRQVVDMRMRDAKTFAQIAQELGIPLSTALTRMRLALDKLKNALT